MCAMKKNNEFIVNFIDNNKTKEIIHSVLINFSRVDCFTIMLYKMYPPFREREKNTVAFSKNVLISANTKAEMKNLSAP